MAKWYEVEVPNTSKDQTDVRPTVKLRVKAENYEHNECGVKLQVENDATLQCIIIPWQKVYSVEYHEGSDANGSAS